MDNIINELQNIGFTKYESQIYISLLKESPLTGYEISKLSGVPQSKVYENITKLLNNNIIINVGTDPIKYIPINPNELLKNKKKEFDNSMDNLKNSLQILNKSKSVEYVLNIKGEKNILKKARICTIMLGLLGGVVGCSKPDNEKDKDASKESKKEVVVGFDNTFVPMGFLDEKGDTVGFDVDLAKETFKRLGMEVKFQPIDWSMKETELNDSKTVDVLWNGYSITDERKKIVSYTEPYLQNKQIIVTLSDSKINSKADLKDKEVGTQQGSTALDAVEKDKDFMNSLKGGAPVLYDTYDKALRDLEIGRTSAVVGDEVLIRYYMGQKGEDKYKVLKDDFGLEDYVVATSKENPELCEKINETLKEMKKDGTFDKIYDKWFK
nr:transporter substrate-binding domain-containing protein [Clostridioides difficile]